jgi:hypothetical protein
MDQHKWLRLRTTPAFVARTPTLVPADAVEWRQQGHRETVSFWAAYRPARTLIDHEHRVAREQGVGGLLPS